MMRKSVVLDFVQPLAAGRQFIGFGWEARRDEPGGEALVLEPRWDRSAHAGFSWHGLCRLLLASDH
jgi:hypothetical protein